MGTVHSELVTALESGDTRGVRNYIMSTGVLADTVLDRAGRPIVFEAAYQGNIDIVRTLTGVGRASLNGGVETGTTVLVEGVKGGHVAMVSHLVESGAVVNTPDKRGFTPLHHAAMMGFADIVEVLLARGADPSPQNANGDTPLHLAARNGHLACVKALFEGKANSHALNKSSETPLVLAESCLKGDVVDYLRSSMRLPPVRVRLLRWPRCPWRRPLAA